MRPSWTRKAGGTIAGVVLACGATIASAQVLAKFAAPDIDQLPGDDAYGKLVRQGRELVARTYAYVGPEVKDPARRYAGNNLACGSCHIDAGARKFANPFVGVYADFPQYRPRENIVGTLEERISGCMERSMNGRPLPPDGEEMRAITAYMHFMSRGVPVGAQVEGRGTPRLQLLDRAADPEAGKPVYAQFCAACHGANGEGRRAGVVGDAKGYAFPPLWGPDSYNTGAGMARLIQAASFIKHNMPRGVTHGNTVLSDEQAFDVAAYINSQPRPQKANLEADFPARFNKPVDAAFPPYLPGFSAEQHKYGPFKPLIAAREKLKVQAAP